MITEEEIVALMDDYGNIRYYVEDLKSSRETALQNILSKYPDVMQEISDMEEELDSKIAEAEKAEKAKKKLLQAYLDEYTKKIVLKDKAEIRSNLVRVGLERKIVYDPTALDGMATENPKLLAFRTEEISTRITLNKK